MSLAEPRPAPGPAADPASADPVPADSAPAGSGSGARRGSTTISGRAVERIVARAVLDVEGVTGSVSGGLLSRLTHPGAAPATADAAIEGATVDLHLEVGARYPVAVADLARAVRSRLEEVLRDTTGLGLGRLDLRIASFERTRRAVHLPLGPGAGPAREGGR